MTVARQPPRLRCVSFNLFHGGVSSGLARCCSGITQRLTWSLRNSSGLQVDVVGAPGGLDE